MNDLLNGPFGVVNIGLEMFAQEMERAGVKVRRTSWKPVAGGDPAIADLLSRLIDETQGLGAKIKEGNQKAFTQLVESQPVLVDVQPAIDVIPGMTEKTVLHAGPPIQWEKMVGAVRGAVIGGLLYEGLAKAPDEAQALARSGDIRYDSCHNHQAVGPMAGIITAHMPVMVIEDRKHGNKAFATMNEGWGRTLRFGAFDEAVIKRLHWMADVLAPALSRAIQHLNGIDVKSIISRALHMGDECHNRDIAASSLFFKEVAPAIVETCLDDAALKSVLDFLSHQEHFFLNVGMASCKVGLIAAENVPYSTMVTAMARNGTEVGIRISGTSDKWFLAAASVPQGLYFPGFSEADANPDMGDSAVTETAGIGAFAMAGAPAIVRFVGGTPDDAIRYTEGMYQITIGEHPYFSLPSLGFRGTPTGIDVRAVVETGITPVINTGIAHKEAGHGLVGAGVVSAPYEAFECAVRFIYSTWGGHMTGVLVDE